MKPWSRLAYPRVYALLEFLERHHRWLLLAEIALLLVALLRALSHLSELHWHEAADAVLLLLLVVFLGSHLVVSLRRGRRGYDFRRLMNRLVPGPTRQHSAEQLLALMAQARAMGTAGAEVPAGEYEAAARAIARESASVFSERTLGSVDAEWEETEAQILSGWFGAVPAAAWRLRHGGIECYSVIVPVSADSYALIRRGHLPTYCAHLDRPLAARWAGGAGPPAPPLSLLAYVQILLPRDAPQEDLSPLFHASVEHLAHLLQLHYGTGWLDAADLRLICEASGPAQLHALQVLGFVGLEAESHGRREALLSPAGFRLCELVAGPGAIGSPLRDFLDVVAAPPLKPE